MWVRRACSLGVALSLVACSSPAVKRVAAVAASHKPEAAAATAKPAPMPTSAFQVHATGRLAGTVNIDARYAVDVGAAQLAGEAVQLIANNGAAVVSNNGSTIISEHGSGLIGKTKRRLLADALPALGTLLPAAGMVVTATSMTTGKLYDTALTDASGVFHLDVPDADKGNVLISAVPPGAAADPRLHYQAVTYLDASQQQAASSNALDEDTAIVYGYLRGHFTNVVYDAINDPDVNDAIKQIGADVDPDTAQLMTSVLVGLRDRARSHGFLALDQDQRRAVAARAADFAIADLRIADVTVNDNATGWTGPADEKALPEMLSLLKQVREAATTKLRGDAHYFDAQPYLQVAGAAAPQIQRPSDLCDYLVNVVLASSDPGVSERLDPVLFDLAIGSMDPGSATASKPQGENRERLHYMSAVNGMLLALGAAVVTQADAMGPLLDQEIDAAK